MQSAGTGRGRPIPLSLSKGTLAVLLNLAMACDQEDVKDVAFNNGEIIEEKLGESQPADGLGECHVGANLENVVVLWAEGSKAHAFETESKTGSIQVILENNSSAPIPAGVRLILNLETETALDLPAQDLPANSKVPVKIDLTAAGMKKAAMKAPGRLLLRVVTHPGTESELIVWSQPAFVHFAIEAQAYIIYDESTLRSKYHNGDITGELTQEGATPGAEFVLGGGA